MIGVARIFLRTCGLLAPLVGIVALTASSVAESPHKVGVQIVRAADGADPAVTTVIYYPAEGAPQLTRFGTTSAMLAANAPIADGKHPLILFSHGTAGSPASHLDTAIALAECGFIVAAVVHSGDNYQDQSAVGTASWMTVRARDIAQAAKFMIASWPEREAVDKDRLGIFGFSAGATTALITMGAKPDFTLVKPFCDERPELVCEILQPGVTLAAPMQDPESDLHIKAAFLASPGFGMAFTSTGLVDVDMPVEIWAGELDANAPFGTNASAIAERLPRRVRGHIIPGAGHFSFLVPCQLVDFPMQSPLCSEVSGFDRVSFHETFNSAVLTFFSEHLPVVG